MKLLPAFDPFTLAAPNPQSLVDTTHAAEVFRKAGWISPVVLAGGRTVGTWKVAATRGGRRVDLSLFRPLRKPERAGLDAEIADVLRFITEQVAGP